MKCNWGVTTIKIYILKKAAVLLPLLLGITFTAFCLLRVLPGDPVYSMVGQRADPETIESIRKEIGADKGFAAQYIGYLKLIARGNFGKSYYTNRDVLTDIASKLPNTVCLALAAMAVAIPCGIAAGMIMAYRRGSIAEKLVGVFSVGGLSIPVFWVGLMAMLVFSLELKILPPSGSGELRFLILPALVLALPAMSSLCRVAAASVEEAMRMAYVRTAAAKGLAPLKVATIHVLRNALVPMVTVIGLDFGSYLSGAVVTETIFGWDGIGRFTMQGIITRDYPVIMGCIIASTAAFVIVNTLTDVLYHYLDPRMRIHDESR
ncbi:MAG TPA: ABC transporter permease [Dissulfurispiraceae bacterium]|nr:ABC transporter permease [Dissulfurispiraceae bacterium]